MRTCPVGHEFDPEQYHRCPRCGISALRRQDGSDEDNATVLIDDSSPVLPEDAIPTNPGIASPAPRQAPATGQDDVSDGSSPTPTPREGETRLLEDWGADLGSLPSVLQRPPGTHNEAQRTPAGQARADAPPKPPPVAPANDAGEDAVVGWLVVIGGPGTGRDHRLVAEGNPIGRSSANLVRLSDPDVAEDTHAVLFYDPAAATPSYYLQPGERRMVYVNEAPIFAATQLRSMDRIRMGGSRMLFVPLCTDRFSWGSAGGAADVAGG